MDKMADNKTLYIIIGIVGALALIVGIGGYYALSDDGYDHYRGKYFVYQVSGDVGTVEIDGTLKMEIIDVDDKMITIKTTYDMYQKPLFGNRTPYMVMSETEKVDHTDDSAADGVWQRSETMSTAWGSKGVDVYLLVEDGAKTTYWIDQKNADVAYKIVQEYQGVTLTMILSATNYF